MMLDTTPYRDRPKAEIAQEVSCMRQIFEKAAPVKLIYEAFGGTGETARVLAKQFPEAKIVAFDLDGPCVRAYNRKGHGKANKLDALVGLLEMERPTVEWGASLDYNRFTILDLERKEGAWK